MSAYPLQTLFKGEFDDTTRARGEHYFARGWVTIVEHGDEHVVASVRGSRSYRVRLGWGPGSAMGCECMAFETYGPCKHLWATALEADHLGFGPVLDAEGGAAAYEERLLDRIEAAEWANAEAATPAADDEGEDWRARLSDLRRRVAGAQRDPWAGLDVGTREIRYVLDIDASRSAGAPVLRTYHCRRLKNGEWGALRDYVPGVDEEPTDPLDRRIFAALSGRGPERVSVAGPAEPARGPSWRGRPRSSSPFAVPRRAEDVANEFVLERELCPDFLPLCCETERLHWLTRREAGGPLAWDGGAAWHLELALQREDEECVLSAELARRDGETTVRLALEAPLALFGFGFLVTRTAIARFDPRGAMAWVAELKTGGPLRVPATEEPDLVARLLELPSGAWRTLPGVRLEEGEPKPMLFVSAPGTSEEGGRERRARPNERLVCRLAFDYGAAGRVAPEDPNPTLAIGAALDGAAPGAAPGAASPSVLVRRDLPSEERALEAALRAGLQRTARDIEESVHGSVLAKHAAELVRTLFAAGWTVEADGRVLRGARGMRASVRSDQDWFDLEGGVEFGESIAPFPAILAAVREGRHTVVLDDGSAGLLPEEWLNRWGLLELASRTRDETLRFAREQGWLLDALLSAREGGDGRGAVAVDAGFEAYRARFAAFTGIEAEREPDTLRGELRGYQRHGLGWFRFLRELGLGGCLADDMGLGKTVQVLALLEARRRERVVRGPADGQQSADGARPRLSIVVAPRSLVFNWIDEAARFAPALRLLDYTGPERKERLAAGDDVDVVVTTYGTLRRDAQELGLREFDYVVLDEAQAIKNSSSQSAKAARLLRGRHRLALSGTPIENHLGELWSIFEFLNPGMLGRSRAFQRFVAAGGGNGRRPNDEPVATRELDGLARALRPFFLRRRKEDVLADLPPKTEQTLACELDDAQRKEYDELAAYYRTTLLASADEGGLGRIQIRVLEALLRLRQLACHPGLVDESRRGEDSAKLATLLPLLEEIAAEGHKALVFSQFTSLLSILEDRLNERGLVYEYLDGRTRDRKERVERFQGDPRCPLFLISLKAGGQGLNLTAADYVFLLDPWWNPAVEAQAIDRAHRIGRTKPVFAYRLIARGTVEEKVVALQADKRELAEAVFRQGDAVLRDLSREDLEALFS